MSIPLIPSFMLLGCLALLNTTTQLAACALFWVLSAVSANNLTEHYGKKNAVRILVGCVLANALLIGTQISPALSYYANTPNAPVFLVISLIAVFISIYTGMTLHEKSKLSSPARDIVSLSIAAIIDSALVISTLYGFGKFSLEKALVVYGRDIAFKLFYSVLSVCVLLILKHTFPRLSLRKTSANARIQR